MSIIPYKSEHLFRLQESEDHTFLIGADLAYSLETVPSFTYVNDDVVLGCAGMTPIWEGRALAWAFVSESIGPHFISVHRAVARFLEAQDLTRIEMAVEVDYEQGHRWALMLGFELEAVLMKSYLPNGADCSLYGRVK